MPSAASPRTGVATAVVAVALTVVAAAVVWVAATSAGDAPVDRVSFLGDSITHNAEADLVEVGAGKAGDVEVVATPGIMTREQLDAAAEVASHRPSVVVINLGTNDAVCSLENDFLEVPCRHPQFEIRDMRDDLRAMAELFDDPTCVVGVEPTFATEAGDEWRLMVDDGTADGVVAWGPQSRELGEAVLLDGIGHLTATGNQLYAHVLWDAVGTICG